MAITLLSGFFYLDGLIYNLTNALKIDCNIEDTQQDLFASPEYHLVQAIAGKRFAN